MNSTSKVRVKIEINGIVQGVGFRPFVYKEATLHSLSGYVLNDGSGVLIEVEGKESQVANFVTTLQNSPPRLSRVDTFKKTDITTQNDDTFLIVASNRSTPSTMLSSDISLCKDCLEEMSDPKNRRYNYPFINCTNCGPRYSIIESLPYDRVNSSMKEFEMCEACKEEYENPLSRRFHTQSISCYSCGPELSSHRSTLEKQESAMELVEEFACSIRSGEAVALKGVGGFHILCDARDEEAVKSLRVLKRRVAKPFAVMFESIAAIKRVCIVTEDEEALILSKERPIVLVRKREDTNISVSVAPNIDKLGVFLSYTPLHELLLQRLKIPVVATSANLSGEPIIKDERELLEKFPSLIEHTLSNDREIVNSCDDSIMMSLEGEEIMLRLSRGFAPKSLYVSKVAPKKILALGANQKSTITIAFDNHLLLSAHIGDLNSIESFEHFLERLESLKRIYSFEPEIIVCDKHPEYETTKWAKEYVTQNPHIELIEVQHHYAHALACMAEHNLEGEVLAFCFDGTGYGGDTLLGSEVMLVSPQSYKREHHLKNFTLLGGEKAIKEPRRVALGLLFESYTLEEILEMSSELVASFSTEEIKAYYLMYEKKINSPQSSSMGRLFDGVYALSGYLKELSYEGESGLVMEALSHKKSSDEHYTYTLNGENIEFESMIEEILNEKDKELVASKFLNTLSNMIVEIAKKHSHLRVILSGGVFQNGALLSRVIKAFKREGIEYYVQNHTPINDGGISLGQAYYALHKGV